MPGFVEATKFSGRFRTLNGVIPLDATHADIIRSLLTVGYPKGHDIAGFSGEIDTLTIAPSRRRRNLLGPTKT